MKLFLSNFILIAAFVLTACSTPPKINDRADFTDSEAVLYTTSEISIRQGYVDTPDGQIHYWEAGKGPAILMIHQSSSSSEEFAGMVQYLSAKYRVVAYDWPGHGMSDDPEFELGVEEFSNGAIYVLDGIGVTKAHVLGHHGGALVAMHLASNYPDRFDKIILSGTSGIKSEEEVKQFSDSLGLKKSYVTDPEGQSLDAAWQRFRKYMPNSTPEEILRPYVTSVVRRVRPYDAHYKVLEYNRRPAIQSIRNREILLLQGENDNFVEHQDTLLNVLPNAKRVVVENTGTFMFYEDPEALAEIITSFLSN